MRRPGKGGGGEGAGERSSPVPPPHVKCLRPWPGSAPPGRRRGSAAPALRTSHPQGQLPDPAAGTDATAAPARSASRGRPKEVFKSHFDRTRILLAVPYFPDRC